MTPNTLARPGRVLALVLAVLAPMAARAAAQGPPPAHAATPPGN